jgi:hypothetical protein
MPPTVIARILKLLGVQDDLKLARAIDWRFLEENFGAAAPPRAKLT